MPSGLTLELNLNVLCCHKKEDDNVVLASTGRDAYASRGFHRGAATTHATRHALARGRKPVGTPHGTDLLSLVT